MQGTVRARAWGGKIGFVTLALTLTLTLALTRLDDVLNLCGRRLLQKIGMPAVKKIGGEACTGPQR